MRRWRFERQQRSLVARRLLEAFSAAYPQARFIEVGANDGDQHDHLRPFILANAWSGIMVEPVPYVFERLRENYAGVERIALANVAIADRDGQLPFFHLRPAEEGEAGVPFWYHGLGSFSRDAIMRHAGQVDNIEARIVHTDVSCLTFDSLCREHAVEHLDLVLIDTEGYDYEIIKRIDLGRYRPRLLAYEHYHLSPEDRSQCRTRIEAAGYETIEEGFDTWCVLPAADELTEIWRGLRPGVPALSVHDESR